MQISGGVTGVGQNHRAGKRNVYNGTPARRQLYHQRQISHTRSKVLRQIKEAYIDDRTAEAEDKPLRNGQRV